jgi:hypothetical protein
MIENKKCEDVFDGGECCCVEEIGGGAGFDDGNACMIDDTGDKKSTAGFVSGSGGAGKDSAAATGVCGGGICDASGAGENRVMTGAGGSGSVGRVGFWGGDASGTGAGKRQLSLFPDEGDEDLLLTNSKAFANLPDEGKILVRGYVEAVGKCDRSGKRFTKRAWAEACGMAPTSLADKLKKWGVRIDIAIRECTIIAGENGAMAGAEALSLLGADMKQAILDGKLSWKNFTVGHLKLAESCARMAGFAVDLPSRSKLTLRDDKGNSVEIENETGVDTGLGFNGARDLMAKLKGNISGIKVTNDVECTEVG